MPAAPVAAALPLEETDLCAVEATEPGLRESFNDTRGIRRMVYVCMHAYTKATCRCSSWVAERHGCTGSSRIS